MNYEGIILRVEKTISRWKIDTPFENWLGSFADKSEFWKRMYVLYYRLFDHEYYVKGMPYLLKEIERQTTIAGIPICNLLSEDKVQEAIHRKQLGGEEIIGHLGRSGWYAAGAAVCEMVEAVICDQRRVFPACAYLNGEYGCKDIYLGVPVVIGKNGIERVIELELDPDDKERFELSHQTVRASLSLIRS